MGLKMPLPSPHSGESEQEFVSRCVKNLNDSGEFESNEQRVAVCYSQFRKGHSKKKKQVHKNSHGSFSALSTFLENEYEFFEYPHQSGKMSWEYWSERGRGRARVLSQLAGI